MESVCRFSGETYKDIKRWGLTSLKLQQVSRVHLQKGDKNGSEQLARCGRSNQRRMIEGVREKRPCQFQPGPQSLSCQMMTTTTKVSVHFGQIKSNRGCRIKMTRHITWFAGLLITRKFFSVLCTPAVLCCDAFTVTVQS